MINVTFKTLNGQEPKGVLSDNFNLNELKGLITKLLGPKACEEWAYICKGKQLRINDPTAFSVQRQIITDGCTIQVGKRAISGGTYPSEEKIAQNMVVEVSRAVDMMTKTSNATCPICLTVGCSCFQFSCKNCSSKNEPCKDCFVQYLKVSDFKYKCLQCNKGVEILAIVPNTSSLCALLKTLEEMQELKRNIDCQICRCGEAKVNTTMYSRQHCERCNRWYCFFCNETWNSQMTNAQYTCCNNCIYENRITFEPVPFNYGNRPHIKEIPNRRHCSQCLELCVRVEGYGGGCPLHTCGSCSYEFCFICLRPGSKCNSDLTNCKIKQQRYEDFPKSTDL